MHDFRHWLSVPTHWPSPWAWALAETQNGFCLAAAEGFVLFLGSATLLLGEVVEGERDVVEVERVVVVVEEVVQ